MPEISLTWVAGYRRSQKGETTHHLFARSRTLQIKLTCGFSISIVLSISPLHAVLDYCVALANFHGVSRAESPSQLTWMSAKRKVSRNGLIRSTPGLSAIGKLTSGLLVIRPLGSPHISENEVRGLPNHRRSLLPFDAGAVPYGGGAVRANLAAAGYAQAADFLIVVDGASGDEIERWVGLNDRV